MSLRTIFILLGLVYLISPFDLIPDRFGWISRIDDIAFAAYLWWQYYRIKENQRTPPEEPNRTKSRSTPASGSKSSSEPTAWEILGLTPDATRDQIENAYRHLMTQYHPDKVHHLGPDLKNLAHEKTIQIQRAYQALTRQ